MGATVPCLLSLRGYSGILPGMGRVVVFVLSFLIFVGGMGLESARADDANAIRQIAQMAMQKQWSAALQTAGQGSSLVQTYFEWLNLQREDNPQDFERYDAFIRAHGDWPGTRRIRANAERAMGGGISPIQAIAFFRDSEPVTARGMILYARALEKSAQAEQARIVVNEWFQDAGLSVDEQDNIWDALKPLISSETMRLRLDHMITEGNEKQARALAKTMGSGYLELAEARLALADKKRDAEARLARVPKHLKDDPGLVVDRMKWRRRKVDDAAPILELFNGLPASFKPYDSRTFWNEQQALIYRLMKEGNYQTAYQVAVRPFHDDKFARGQAEWMAGHVALVYLKQPGRAFRHFEALYKMSLSPLTRARAAYWSAEACAKLGYPDVARAWYRTASAYRGNFYGQLAAVKIPEGQRPYRQGPPIASVEDRAAFASSELPRMARLFMQAGDTVRAENFINRMADLYAGKGGLIRLTVDMAIELKLTSVAVKISRSAAMDGIDFADYVYPTLTGVGTGDVETALVYAVIRQESGFDIDAVSPVGARGLMQLMPSTAKAVARAEKQRHDHEWLTSKPAHNIRLGSAYLKQLVEQFDSYPLAIAAYNAGPGRVNGWLKDYGDPRTGAISLVDWIEQIPVYETRNYVQRVLEGTAVYRQKLKTQKMPEIDPLHLAP